MSVHRLQDPHLWIRSGIAHSLKSLQSGPQQIPNVPGDGNDGNFGYSSHDDGPKDAYGLVRAAWKGKIGCGTNTRPLGNWRQVWSPRGNRLQDSTRLFVQTAQQFLRKGVIEAGPQVTRGIAVNHSPPVARISALR